MKQPDWKVPFVLALSLLVLGTFAYWLQYSHKPKQNKADAQLKKPIPLPSEDAQIIQFRIKSASGVIEGKCNDLSLKSCKAGDKGNWTLTYPNTMKADPDAVKEVLTNATSMLASDTVDLTEETPEKRKKLLEEYGLSDEQRTKIGSEFIEITLDGGKKLTAWFGEPYPVGDKVFVGSSTDGNLNDKTIFIVANFYKGVFSKPFNYFRDKTALEFNRSDITAIDAKTSKGKFEAHLENGNWLINGKRGDDARINNIISGLAMLRAKDFVNKDVLKGAKSVFRYDLKGKTATYSIELFDKTSKQIKVPGHEAIPGESHLYVQTSTVAEPMEVDQMIRTEVDKGPGELRYSILLNPADKATITNLKIQGPGSEMDFHYDGKAWTQTDAGQKVDVSHVAHLLESISTEHAIDIVSPAPALSTGALTVSTGDDKSGTKPRFVVYGVKGKVYAKDLNQVTNEAFILDPSEKNEFPFDQATWKAAPPAPPPVNPGKQSK